MIHHTVPLRVDVAILLLVIIVASLAVVAGGARRRSRRRPSQIKVDLVGRGNRAG